MRPSENALPWQSKSSATCQRSPFGTATAKTPLIAARIRTADLGQRPRMSPEESDDRGGVSGSCACLLLRQAATPCNSPADYPAEADSHK